MCIEMCIELILELAGFALLLALCDVVLFPSPAPESPQVKKTKKVFSVSKLNSYLFNLLRSSTTVIRPCSCYVELHGKMAV